MMTTAETGSLATALAKFQAEMPVVPKTSTANAGTYSYTYAGLADIVALAMPLLAKNGLAFTALPAAGERGFVLTGVLLHESGERLEGTLPISGSRPQEIGSSLTYARRYLFTCMTGLVTDDDDDGALAQRAERSRLQHDEPERKAERVSAHADDQWTTNPGDGKNTLPVSDKTRARMFATFADWGVTDPDLQRAGMSRVLDREVESRGAVTEGEALDVIKSVRSRPKPAPAPVVPTPEPTEEA